MPGLDGLLVPRPPAEAFAYVGLGPGQELIPYFLALLGFVGAALLAVLQWPLSTFLRYLSRIRKKSKGEPKAGPPTPETPGEGRHDEP